MPQKTCRFHDNCPRKLQNLPPKSCSLALLRIEIIQAGKRELPDLPGCPWYVNDVMSNFCWFVYADEIRNSSFSSHTTKEIGQQLAINSGQVEKTEKLGMEKLIAMQNSPELQEMLECVADLQQGNMDDTIYAIGTFTTEVIEELGKIFNGAEESNDNK